MIEVNWEQFDDDELRDYYKYWLSKFAIVDKWLDDNEDDSGPAAIEKYAHMTRIRSRIVATEKEMKRRGMTW